MSVTVPGTFQLLALSGAGEISPGLYISKATTEKLVRNSTHIYAHANRRALVAGAWINGISTSSISYEIINNSFVSFSADRFAVDVHYKKDANADIFVEICSTGGATVYASGSELGTSTEGTFNIDASTHASFVPGQDITVRISIKNSGSGTVKLYALTVRETALAAAGLPPLVKSATIATGSLNDGYNLIQPVDGYTVWATALAASSATASAGDASATFYMQASGRGTTTYGLSRGYYRFDGSNFASGISKVESATVKIYCGNVDNSPDADVNKWKLYKHNNISTTLADSDYSNFDAAIYGTEATATAGGYVSFAITGDLLAYVNCQAKSQANVAFSLRCKLDYDSTAPTGVNSVNWHFSESASNQDPQLEYTYYD